MFKGVRDSDWSARHIAAHGVTLDEVREAVLERPYWSVPGRDGTTLAYGQTYAGRFSWWWRLTRAAWRSSSRPAT